ncbi:flippase [Caballeronia sp. SBC1]|uniref:flippase n=1 Tax=Caballeronia sp. SBC1 TaxID=2705548 RepID=UPI001FB57C8F|nr:flippase [Caballeronia sp. SBC1]
MSDQSSVGTSTRRAPKAATGLGRNFVAMLVWQIGNYLVPLATFPYLTRILGPTGFGVLGYVMAIAIYGTVLTEWGFNLSGPKAVVALRGRPVELNELIWSTIGAKACLCVVSFGALLVVLHFDHQAAAARTAILLSWLVVVSNIFTLNWLLQGLERFSLFATVSLAGRFLTLPLTFLLVHQSGDIAIAVGIQAAAPVLTAIFSMVAAQRLGVLRSPMLSWSSVRSRLEKSTDMFVSSASVTLFGATNTVILASLAGPYQVGLYVAADKLKTVGNMVPAQINTILYPRISALMVDAPRAAAKLTLIGLIATAATTMLGVLVVTFLSGHLTSLILGSAFHDSATVLQLLCLATLFGNLAYFLGLQVLVPFADSRRRSIVMLVGGALSISLSIVLVPRYGANGAAGSFLIAEIAILCTYLLIILRSTPMRAHFKQVMNW